MYALKQPLQSSRTGRFRKTNLVRAIGLFAVSLMLSSGDVWAKYQDTYEPHNTGWSVQLDNDLFVGGKRDQDYTGGIVVTLSGRRAAEYGWSPERLRSWTDNFIGIGGYFDNEKHHSVHALEWGTALFTPNDIRSTEANPNDRPYASLFFLNSTKQTIVPGRKLSVKSGLTIGLLGLGFAETLQREIHDTLGNTKPGGWNHQISNGGELTAKYSLSFQKALHQKRYGNGLGQELNLTGKVDVGFTTGVGVGFNWRFGRINTPWWSFNPHQSEYLNLGSNISTAKVIKNIQVRERYLYVGGSLNHNVYNAFLQGQFRRSGVSADRSDVIANVGEFWGGFSNEFSNHLRIDVFVRKRGRELDLAESKALSWGGVILSRSY